MVGLLPAEEAAIRKALRESLRTAAAERDRDESSSSLDSSPSPSPKEQHVGSKRRVEANSHSHPPAKRVKLKKQKNKHSSVATFNGVSGNKSSAEHLLPCQSPARLSVPTSPVYGHSSPVISESGSLKLVLSSSSSDSSSSHSSPAYSSHKGSSKQKPAKKTFKKSLKAKRVLLAEFSTSAMQEAKPLKGKGSKSTPKQKGKSKDRFIGNAASKIKSGKKLKHIVSQDSKGKATKAKLTTPGKKERKKVTKKLADDFPVGAGLSSTLTSFNFPDIPDSGVAETVSGSPAGAECEEEREDEKEKQKTTTFTWYMCTYDKFMGRVFDIM